MIRRSAGRWRGGRRTGRGDHHAALDLAAASLDFELTSDEASFLRYHLGTCAACRESAEAIRRDARALATLTTADASAGVRRQVLERASRLRRSHPGPKAVASAAAALALVIGVAAVTGIVLANIDADVGPVARVPFEPVDGVVIDAGPGAAEAVGVAAADGVIVVVGADADGATRWCREGHAWRRTSGFAGRASRMTAVTAGGPGFVALGMEIGRSGGSRATAYTSDDGRQWQQATVTGAFDGAVARSVASSGPTIVAVGQRLGPERAAAWISPDGRIWARAASIEDAAGARMTGVAATATGFVAVGHDAAGGAVWRSTDGRSWQRLDRTNEETARLFNGARVLGVASGPGGFVAIGYAAAPSGELHGTIWTSTDGSAWERHQPPDMYGATLTTVSSDDRRWLVAGQAADGPAAWWSTDGQAWKRGAAVLAAPQSEVLASVIHDREALLVGRGGGRPLVWAAGSTD